jgi:lipopolysaccharide/colanic/teichoic acid biosynthesis glycosyltransferase
MTMRRLLDVCVAAVLLVMLSWLFAILMAANQFWAGRLFFRQIRVGRALRPFSLLKFQTMVTGAEAGSTVTVAGDPRITPYGRVLRLSKLDELPQLINLLRGEMSLIGPRPLTPNEIQFVPRYLAAAVYRTRPGLTGISALAFSDEERLLSQAANPQQRYFGDFLQRKLTLELAYTQRQTWATDLTILLLTALAPFQPHLPRRWLNGIVPTCGGLLSVALEGYDDGQLGGRTLDHKEIAHGGFDSDPTRAT